MMRAHYLSIADSRRQFLTLEELVYDHGGGNEDGTNDRVGGSASGARSSSGRRARGRNVWSFRFKRSAGAAWTGPDPWHSGRPCRKLAFLRDGTVMQVNPLGDDGHPPGPPAEQQQQRHALADPPWPMRWRLLARRPVDLPDRPRGSYLRLTVAGRDVPTYSVSRCDANWGFVLESCWGLYANFELPPRDGAAGRFHGLSGAPPPQHPPLLPVRQRRRLTLRRTEGGGALWVAVDGDDEDEDENGDGDRQQGDGGDPLWDHPSMQKLRDDSQLPITNEVQWREAFLYNVGARVLPEGDDALDEFDRAWQGGA
jgi:hypothetical protein